MPGYRHAIVSDAPPDKTWEAVDFGTLAKRMKMEMTGDPAAVGTDRIVAKGKKLTIVETQVYREIRNDGVRSHSYNIASTTPETTPWEKVGVKGYLATVTVWPLSEDPNKSFVEWKATWEAATPQFANLGERIHGNIHYAIDVLTGKRAPANEEDAQVMPRMSPSKL